MADKVKIKIRHGLAFYIDEDGHQYTAFRNQIVAVPSKEADRLKNLGAAVDSDQELPMGGRLTPLPNTASDEELLAWVSVATKAEIAATIAEHPQLGDRLLAARDVFKKQLEAQQELLSGIDSTVKKGKQLAKKRKGTVQRGAPTSGADGRNAMAQLPSGDADEDDDDEEEFDEDDPREVVKGNVGDVGKFLQDNPAQAEAILEAENARAASKNIDPRTGVVTAVQETINARNT